MNRAALWATLRNPLRPLLQRDACRQWLGRLLHKANLHFLHIGKTGGSAIKFVFAGRPLTPDFVIRLHEHTTHLDHLPAGEKFFFIVRDPISRFVSAFFSRQRCGQPRIYSPWSAGETEAFQNFATPDAVACELDSPDAAQRARAEHAMRTIRHVNSSYWDWFRDEDFFRSRRDDLFCVLHQDSLDRGFAELVSKLRLPPSLHLPTDGVSAHRNPDSVNKRLSERARHNLQHWYAREYRFLELCRELTNS